MDVVTHYIQTLLFILHITVLYKSISDRGRSGSTVYKNPVVYVGPRA